MKTGFCSTDAGSLPSPALFLAPGEHFKERFQGRQGGKHHYSVSD